MTLGNIRALAALLVSALAVLTASATIVMDMTLQGSFGIASTVSLAGIGALAITFLTARQSAAYRYLSVTVLMSGIAAALVAAQGMPWQTDLHMAFFAALAISALLYDIPAILLGTAIVAVHHLGLGMTLPNLVFYGGGNFGRILLHAVILIVEAAGLIWLMHNTFKLLAIAQENSLAAETNAEQSRALAREVEEGEVTRRDERNRTMTELRTEFGSVVAAARDGDFSRRVPTDFAETDLNELGRAINALVETIEIGLGETSSVMAALSHQDLTQRVNGTYGGAFARLKDDTNAVADRLSGVVKSIRAASGSLRHATGELLTGADDLSQRTNQQASTVRDTTTCIEALAQTVRVNAGRAGEASEATERVVQTAQTGSAVMSETTEAMARIGKSSGQISGIISTMDDIAFQTNLLALNASVEAARAGEAGKGFAVVAVEVRRLAQSAAEASSDIKSLIEQATSQIGEGTQLVGRAASTLTEIASAAQASNALMEVIAREANLQSKAISDVDAAVQRIDELTQHNASLVEETNAAISQAQAQAAALDGIVGVFKVSAHEGQKRQAA